ncbi:MAG: hypothetical protein MJA82_02900 [Clostridia bacterium]|nr:hypothetical protein [Clostridia bacterium]
MKKIFLLLVIISSFLMPPFFVVAESIDRFDTIEEALSAANSEIKEEYSTINYDYFLIKNLNNKAIEENMYFDRTLFVYGEKNGFNASSGHYRYLGETMAGEPFSNIFHPLDVWGGGTLEDYRWIQFPWENFKVATPNVFNGNPEYLDSMKKGLELYNPDLYNPGDNTDWSKYVQILQPPTHYTWGMGRMWNTGKKTNPDTSRIYYKTVPMAPFYLVEELEPIIETPDLYVKSIEPSTTVTEPGKTYNATVTYGLKDYTETVKAKLGLTHNGYSVSGIDGQEIKFQPWEEKTLEFTFTGQKDKSSIIEAKIWPVSLTDDKNWNNNSKKVIMPLKEKIDLSVKMAYAPEFIDYGEKNSLEADIRSNSKNNIETKVIWRVNGKIVKKYTVTIRPNKTLSNGIDYTPPSSAKDGDTYTISVEVNPDHNQPANESTWSNNKSQTKVEVFKDEREDSGLGPSIIIE